MNMQLLTHIFLLLFATGVTSLYATEQDKCTYTVKDILNKEVCIPATVDRIIITCYGGASQEIALFMGADTIVAQPSSARFNHFLKIYPQLKDIKSAGTFNDVNLETIIKLQPDIVFAGITSKVTNDRIKDLNIPLFTLGIGRHTIQTLLQEFEHVGTILGQEKKAALLISFWNSKLKLIQNRVANTETSKLQRVFYSNSANLLSSENKQWWGDEFINAAGGINVASQIPVKGSISPETLTLWNPDTIILSTNKKYKTSLKEFQTNRIYQNLQAVKNRAIYKAPTGAFWWDRPSPESILGIIWLSKILYPQRMQDIDLKQETKEFYKIFYDYELSDSEYLSFIDETLTTQKDKK